MGAKGPTVPLPSDFPAILRKPLPPDATEADRNRAYAALFRYYGLSDPPPPPPDKVNDKEAMRVFGETLQLLGMYLIDDFIPAFRIPRRRGARKRTGNALAAMMHPHSGAARFVVAVRKLSEGRRLSDAFRALAKNGRLRAELPEPYRSRNTAPSIKHAYYTIPEFVRVSPELYLRG